MSSRKIATERNLEQLIDAQQAIFDDNVAIRVSHVSKVYQIYASPKDRLKQAILARISRVFGRTPKRYFREFAAVQAANFEIRKGEIVGIIGKNGSGKSTLLQIICGTLYPTSGCVEINGRVAALLELGSGFNPEFTGRENVYMNASILGLTEAEIDLKYDDIVAFADIGEFIDRPVKTYSSGMLVRLAFGVIAHVDADILVVDEALSVGDAFFVQKCMRFLRSFMKTGTILFVSHDTGAVLNLCNTAIWLQGGEVMAQGDAKQVTDCYLKTLYESLQGGSGEISPSPTQPSRVVATRDMRLDFLNQTNLRNDIELFEFSEQGTSFGKLGARISNAYISDRNHQPLSWVVGGEAAELHVECSVFESLRNPIVGFQVRDRLGQVIFGDNTYVALLGQTLHASAGNTIIVSFSFVMPVLPVGDYTVSLAIADGTQDEHVQQHWLNDAISFKSHSSSVSSGLMGIPMQEIHMVVR
ncbi:MULTISPECIES: ABC transporter ATP-binding protein [unclassified Rhizobium]|uniref:ABC transporter ATP-binding protein n=1 Tax=unclassified Rhizobium TaxID=2613769 RepID=UPI001ADA1AB4|nr:MULTISPECIES: ABC transporter ATP-binding protein [unclassified Rhizobium]MBO9127831.1 ABC transporter ATP-binding protein [Rhizobium sp. 16-488-2b]MBO9176945.1 ABC transporter ATP-binding protein [Rhizobium sp. 16-488-2a]